MRFKPAIWRPIAIVLSIVNLVAAGFAARSGEASHATIHAVLAVGFALWAQRMGKGSGGAANELARFDALEADVNDLRRELSEVQERLDFAERLLAQGPAVRRVDSES